MSSRTFRCVKGETIGKCQDVGPAICHEAGIGRCPRLLQPGTRWAPSFQTSSTGAAGGEMGGRGGQAQCRQDLRSLTDIWPSLPLIAWRHGPGEPRTRWRPGGTSCCVGTLSVFRATPTHGLGDPQGTRECRPGRSTEVGPARTAHRDSRAAVHWSAAWLAPGKYCTYPHTRPGPTRLDLRSL